MKLLDQVGLPSPRWRRAAILNDSLEKLRVWTSPPSFAGEERARASRTLFLLSLGLMAMGAFSLAQAWVHHWMGTTWTEGVEELCLIAAFWFNRRGEVERATQVICFSELACGLVLISLFRCGIQRRRAAAVPTDPGYCRSPAGLAPLHHLCESGGCVGCVDRVHSCRNRQPGVPVTTGSLT